MTNEISKPGTGGRPSVDDALSLAIGAVRADALEPMERRRAFAAVLEDLRAALADPDVLYLLERGFAPSVRELARLLAPREGRTE